MKKIVTAFTACILAAGALSPVAPAHAGDGGAIAAGILGGLAAGAIIGGAAAAPPRPVYVQPAPVYMAPPPPPPPRMMYAEPVYDAPPPRCYMTRGEPMWDGYAWVRPRQRVCE